MLCARACAWVRIRCGASWRDNEIPKFMPCLLCCMSYLLHARDFGKLYWTSPGQQSRCVLSLSLYPSLYKLSLALLTSLFASIAFGHIFTQQSESILATENIPAFDT